ncbi:HAD-IIIA family hydrolase [Pseudonocardia sp. WMMC193]|uniref:HAD-IIIA family hydrolase n=1 Tax=Pseudonocardia sp. WMMC193 TaxID=2911965 RepID=UPI001F3967AC|nr:HAD-IIIA family hydrolase [Pseudonocardia sp. WMMC193]MCF7553542.1 HAD-IIIA family hydrolase [Pseudonocardia sp. WMMC193]
MTTVWNPPAAILFDRDGTLVVDVPYCDDPSAVRPMRTAARALGAVRARGLPVGVVSTQSGVGRGLLRRSDVEAVNREVDRLLGPFDTWQVCPHTPAAGCRCRKPAPGLVLAAAAALGLPPHRVAVVGDIGADVDAAHAAGAVAVLVPTAATRVDEVGRAPVVASDLVRAVDYLLHGPCVDAA